MSDCPNNRFGHNAAHHGVGCAGCDAEHKRVTEKLLGSPPTSTPFPDITNVYALENDDGTAKLYKFLNGNDDVRPDAYDDLAHVRTQAMEIANRCLRYVALTNAVENSLDDDA